MSSVVFNGRPAATDSQIAYFDVDLTPSLDRGWGVKISVSQSPPPDATALVVPVASSGEVPAGLGFDRAALAAAGFDGKAGQTLVTPRATGPTLVALGIGDPARLDAAAVRDGAAAFARAV